jgi:hypothetical protein
LPNFYFSAENLDIMKEIKLYDQYSTYTDTILTISESSRRGIIEHLCVHLEQSYFSRGRIFDSLHKVDENVALLVSAEHAEELARIVYRLSVILNFAMT